MDSLQQYQTYQAPTPPLYYPPPHDAHHSQEYFRPSDVDEVFSPSPSDINIAIISWPWPSCVTQHQLLQCSTITIRLKCQVLLSQLFLVHFSAMTRLHDTAASSASIRPQLTDFCDHYNENIKEKCLHDLGQPSPRQIVLFSPVL